MMNNPVKSDANFASSVVKSSVNFPELFPCQEQVALVSNRRVAQKFDDLGFVCKKYLASLPLGDLILILVLAVFLSI